MKKIAIINEDCYSQAMIPVLPFLVNSYTVGLFSFFNYSTPQRRIDDFLHNIKHLELSEVNCLKFSNRMRSFTTRREMKNFLLSIKRWNPDVVYVNADGFPWGPFLFRRIIKNVPIIAAIHDVKAHSSADLITKIYKSFLPRMYEYLNTYSEYSYKQLQEKCKHKKIFCCHHPLSDFGYFEKIPHKKFTILFFGYIAKYKGLSLLIDAGLKAYELNQNICIKIVGKGEDENILVPYLKHPAFNIINRRVEDSEIPFIFSDVDCIALPYKDASQSGPMMIALNYSLPVLATDIAAFQWFGENFSEVHLLKNDPEIWKNEILRLAKLFPNSFSMQNEYQEEIMQERKHIEKKWSSLFNNV